MQDVFRNLPGTDIMICETNYWMNLHDRYSEEQRQALKTAERRDKGQADWIAEFMETLIRICDPRLKAVIFYELLDEPVFEKNLGDYLGESHFGFIECDEKGGSRVKKPAFYTLQKINEAINGG